MTIRECQTMVHDLAVTKGWYDLTEGVKHRSIPEILMLIVSEISEALEEHRKGKQPFERYYSDNGKPEGFGIELADAVIRIMDACQYLGIDLQSCIEDKHKYNQTRPYRHGGKRA